MHPQREYPNNGRDLLPRITHRQFLQQYDLLLHLIVHLLAPGSLHGPYPTPALPHPNQIRRNWLSAEDAGLSPKQEGFSARRPVWTCVPFLYAFGLPNSVWRGKPHRPLHHQIHEDVVEPVFHSHWSMNLPT